MSERRTLSLTIERRSGLRTFQGAVSYPYIIDLSIYQFPLLSPLLTMPPPLFARSFQQHRALVGVPELQSLRQALLRGHGRADARCRPHDAPTTDVRLGPDGPSGGKEARRLPARQRSRARVEYAPSERGGGASVWAAVIMAER